MIISQVSSGGCIYGEMQNPIGDYKSTDPTVKDWGKTQETLSGGGWTLAPRLLVMSNVEVPLDPRALVKLAPAPAAAVDIRPEPRRFHKFGQNLGHGGLHRFEHKRLEPEPSVSPTVLGQKHGWD
ncbi:hypothetical protein MRS44_012393 [Fusarium solani]|uniref:uncharacterized protein n=1 Tax=Fusarium solani TaxID=169388 RepID=UPI0032C4AA04|nr:hypothetical protein MRS44_012393 [Fusarium solani]